MQQSIWRTLCGAYLEVVLRRQAQVPELAHCKNQMSAPQAPVAGLVVPPAAAPHDEPAEIVVALAPLVCAPGPGATANAAQRRTKAGLTAPLRN